MATRALASGIPASLAARRPTSREVDAAGTELATLAWRAGARGAFYALAAALVVLAILTARAVPYVLMAFGAAAVMWVLVGANDPVYVLTGWVDAIAWRWPL